MTNHTTSSTVQVDGFLLRGRRLSCLSREGLVVIVAEWEEQRGGDLNQQVRGFVPAWVCLPHTQPRVLNALISRQGLQGPSGPGKGSGGLHCQQLGAQEGNSQRYHAPQPWQVECMPLKFLSVLRSRCSVGCLYPTLECLGLSLRSAPDPSFLLMCTREGNREGQVLGAHMGDQG